MNHRFVSSPCNRVGRMLLALSGALLASARVHAQAAARESSPALAKYDTNKNRVLDADEAARKRSDDEAAAEGMVTLNPFEVRTDRDTSYGATREEDIGAMFVGDPRQCVWTNRISF